jgi:hypothetical protein
MNLAEVGWGGIDWISKKATNHYEDQDVSGWMTLRCVLQMGGVDLTSLAQDRDMWRVLVNAVMNL